MTSQLTVWCTNSINSNPLIQTLSHSFHQLSIPFFLAIVSIDMAGLVTGSSSQRYPHDSDESLRGSLPSSRTCRVCSDEIGLKEDGKVFVACVVCNFPVCRPCYEYERSEGNKCCPQCNNRYKHHKGSPRVIGDDEEAVDGDDFDDEFPIKHLNDNFETKQSNHLDNDNNYNQNLHTSFSVAGSVNGKDLEGEKEGYGNAEWKERIDKWKVRQQKRGFGSKDDGINNNDQGEEDDYL